MVQGKMLCGHTSAPIHQSKKILCSECGSYLDLTFGSSLQPVSYDETYSTYRDHFDELEGNAKARSLAGWLKNQTIDVRNKNVCEVGFGGGHSLKMLSQMGAKVYGLEVNPASIKSAQKLGIPTGQVFLMNDRFPDMNVKIDLWLFLDSFEHVTKPGELLGWMEKHSNPSSSEIIIVIPEGQSLSDKWMGRFWPNRVPDHSFFWSKKGILSFFESFGYHMEDSFYPAKVISLQHVLRHLGLMFNKPGFRYDSTLAKKMTVRFNIGEMGLLLSKERSR